jgi:1A family penicillin-binding protein
MKTVHRFAHWFRRRRLRTRIALILAASFVLLTAGVWAWLTYDLPPIDRLQAGLALPSTRIYDRSGRLLYEIIGNTQTSGRNTAIPLSEIPAHCINATIATEDANFYSHPGVDVVGILRAAWINVQGGEVIAGGSTITQQVARNLLFDPQQRAERSLRRKLREMLLAIQLQMVYSKDDILALYLNQSYYGNLAYGIEAAARAYFARSAQELSLAECALLAGLLQAPGAYDPLTNLVAAKTRQEAVLDLMAQAGMISAEEAESARRQELQFASSPFPIEAPHFVMAVIRQLERSYGEALYTEGLEVITTVDLDWQNAAQTIVRQQLARLNDPTTRTIAADANNAALVAMDPYTGQVLTMLGSPDYFDESIDGAVNAALASRQPGSALKPFTYAAAMDPTRPDPWTPATMLLDVRTPFVTRRLESYTPANFGLVENGPVLLREALASSLNVPAVVTLEHVGVSSMINLITNAGVTTLTNNPNLDLAVTLGGGEVRLLDLTQAYSIFPNGGWRVDPVFILSVRNASGDLLYQWQPQPPSVRVIDERVAYLINHILSDDQARILGFGRYSALNIGRPAAAKTGTTTDYRDNWIIGYTPNLVTGVWVGNADNRPMREVTGVSGAAPIWNAFMRTVLRGQPELQFEQPDGIIRMDVCALSGLLPTPQCQRTRSELFIDGTQPRQPDNLYQTFTIDTRTGQLADENTPPEYRVERVYVVMPQEARDWAIRHGYPPPPVSTARVSEDDNRLRLLAPDPYTSFQLSSLLPREAQRLRLTVGAPTETVSVTYELNGEAIGTAEASPWVVWWPLEVGDHELVARATLRDGSEIVSDAIPFRVTVLAPPESFNMGER